MSVHEDAHEPRPQGPAALLHNMSMRPNLTVRHDGVSTCRRLVLRMPDVFCWRLPASGDVDGWASTWCRVLGLEHGGDARARLSAELDFEVERSALPDVVPVLADDPAGAAPGESSAHVPSRDDPRPPVTTLSAPLTEPNGSRSSLVLPIGLVLAVFAKSSPKVFLARKAPSLSRLEPGSVLVLALPDFRRQR